MSQEVDETKQRLLKAIEAEDKEGASEILNKLFELADKGDAAALIECGDIEQNGRHGRQKDEIAAFDYFDRAVKIGTHAEAFGRLADIYRDKSNFAKVIEIASIGAEKGDATSMGLLGVCLVDGQGATKDEISGIRWLKRSGDLGYEPAVVCYALMLRDGRGVSADPEKSIDILQKLRAESKSFEESLLAFEISKCYSRMGKEDEEKKWLRISADAGNQDAKKKLNEIDSLRSESKEQPRSANATNKLKQVSSTNKSFDHRREKVKAYFLGAVGAVAVSGLLAIAGSSWFFGIFSFGLFIVLCMFFLGPFIVSRFEAGSVKKAEEILANCRYRYYNRKTAIGVEPDAGLLHLIEGGNYKAYPFSEVRNWERKASTGGPVHGIHFVKGTGLFVSVRDIDYPYWNIIFEPYDFDKELPRWMEILSHHINENPK